MPQIRIGCSGWAYRDWKGPFYPADLKDRDRLGFYASVFDTCEINASFYRLPSEAAVAAWREGAPEGFVYAWKVSRFLSHNKKLNEPKDSIDLIFGRMAGLGDRQGPALLQLPPMLRRNDERLDAYLSLAPKGVRLTVEFRHPSWYDREVFDLLERHDAALCISDHHDAPSPWERTASWVYVRGHGPGGRYFGRYGEALEDWAGRIRRWSAEGCDVYAYFDNDIKAAAPADAQQLKAMLAAKHG